MRRTIASVGLAAALLLGAVGALTPARAALLCPPGCLVAGSTQGIGGFPNAALSPTDWRYNGTFTVTAVTNHNSGTADFTRQYYVRILGDVTLHPNQDVTGTADYAVSTSPFTSRGASFDTVSPPSDFFTGTVAVNGKRYAIQLPGTYISMTLNSYPLTTCPTCNASYTGTFFYNH